MKVLTEQWHQQIQNRISTAVQRAHRLESLQLLPRERQEGISSRRCMINCLSPGGNTKQFIEKDNRTREYQRNFNQSIEYKRRRRELKSSITQQTSTYEIKEGATYEPAVDLQCPECPAEEIPSQCFPPRGHRLRNCGTSMHKRR